MFTQYKFYSKIFKERRTHAHFPEAQRTSRSEKNDLKKGLKTGNSDSPLPDKTRKWSRHLSLPRAHHQIPRETLRSIRRTNTETRGSESKSKWICGGIEM